MNITGTQTGRFKGRKNNVVDLPEGAHYMSVTGKGQLAAAILAVEYDGPLTIIDVVNADGAGLVRYTFNSPDRLRNQTREQFEKHLRGIASRVRKSPAGIWK